MSKKRIITLALSVILLIGMIVGVALSASAETTVTDSDWLAKPAKTLVKCPGGNCDHKSCDYVYSFAVIGDTQNINIGDVNNKTAYTKGIYEWILANKDSKNISYVMGVGDITQAYYKGYGSGIWVQEWENAGDALSVLDGEIGYSLVRGNHDITDGFNGTFGKTTTTTAAYYQALAALAATNDSEGRPMAGFLNESKIEDTYRKIEAGGHKYIIFTLDWHPTEECLVWLDATLAANSDYTAIITLHTFATRDATIIDDYEDTFPHENLTGSRPNWEEVSASGGQVAPKVLWQTVLSKHANVKFVLSGHIDEDNILVEQFPGANGNTVTSMLIDGQTIDSDFIKAGKDPVGLVAMLYFSADGKVVNVEYISSVRANKGQNAYLRADNQFELTVDYSDGTDSGWTKTPHGSVRTDIYEQYPFHILMDDDSDESTDAFHFGSYSSWQETLKAIHDFAGNTRPSSHKKMKTYYIVMSRDVTDSYSGIHDNRAGKNFGKTVLDLNDHTLTLTSSGSNTAFLALYVNSSGPYPRFDIINGDINIGEKVSFIVGQAGTSAQGQTGTINLRDLNITYMPSETGASFYPLIGFYDGSGTGSNYNITIDNCNIDYSKADGAYTVLNLADKLNNSNNNITMIGGSIKGTTAANTTIFTRNDIYDGITLAPDANGNYTAFTLSDNGTLGGIFAKVDANGVMSTVELGNPTLAGETYTYSTVSTKYEITDYGIIDTATYPVATYPLALSKDGVILEAYTGWNEAINTIVKTAEKKSGCTLLLRRDHNTANDNVTTSSSNLNSIVDLKVDLGGHTLTRGSSRHFLQAITKNSGDQSTTIRFTNGTIVAQKERLIAFNDQGTSAGKKEFNFIFDGITFDLSAGYGIAVCFKDGVNGSKSTVTFNDCIIDRGAATKSIVLFDLNDQLNTGVTPNVEKNMDDVSIVINGGKLKANSLSGVTFASFDPERESGKGSPDSVIFGKGSDGKYLTVELPEGASAPTAAYALTEGTYYLSKNSTEGGKDYYTFENATTVFGDVTKTYVSTTQYPFALFVKSGDAYTFNSGYATLAAAINAAKTAAPGVGDEAYIAMRRDYDSTGEETSTIRNLQGKITVDLGGFMLSSSANKHMIDIHMDYSKYADNANYTSTIVFQNGSMQNNRSGSYGLVTLGHAGTNSVAKHFEFIFNNVTFALKSNPIIQGWNHDAKTGLDVDIYLNGCTFDFSGATEGKTIFALAGSNPYTRVNIHLDGCDAIASDFSKYSIFTKGDEDTVTLYPDENGVYLTVTQTSGSTPILAGYVTSDSRPSAFTLTSSADGKYVYEIIATGDAPTPGEPEGGTPDIDLSITTPYGTIPAEYTDASLYPVIVFKNGEYLANSNTIAAGAYTAIALPELKASTENTVTILLRADLTEELAASIGSYEMKGKLVIDLGGNTYTSSLKALFSCVVKSYSSNKFNPSIEVKNGRLDCRRLLQCGNQSTAYGQQYDVTFSGVTFGFISSYWETLVDTNAGANYEGGYSLTNITFEDCIFDLRTNEKASSKYTIFNLAKDVDNNVANIVIKGGEILFGNATTTIATINSDYADNSGYPAGGLTKDTVRFEKGTDGYTVFTYKVGGTVLTDTCDSTDLTFTKIAENSTDVSYRLIPKAVAEQNFVPKANITLGSGFVFNIYVPANENLTALKLDGKDIDLSALTAEDGYYVFGIELEAKTAARDIKLVSTLTVDGKDMIGTFTFSIPKYAKKVLDDTAIGNAEKVLVKDVLAYIRAAYAYFGTDDSEAIAKINAIIGIDYSNPHTAEGSTAAATAGLKSATFVLDGTPAMRFYLADGADADSYAFYIKGYRVDSVISENGKYIDIDVYAFELCETVTYTVDGEEAGSFHIAAYYAYVSGNDYTEANKAELVKLTDCFWRYLQSARDYRNSVIGK